MATQIEDENLSGIGREIVDGARRMVELEVALARIHVELTLLRARNGLLVASAGISLLFLGLLFWLLALAFALGLLQHPIGYFLSGSFFIILAALAGLFGFRTIRKAVSTTESAVENLKGDVEWARQLPSKHASSSS
jgi:hypothetical protein